MSNDGFDNRSPSPLQQVGINDGPFSSSTLVLREIANVTVLRLHSLEDAGQLSARLTGIGIDLPLQTGQCSGQDPVVLCLRPNDYLLCSEQLDALHWISQLRPLIDPALTSLFNSSDGLATFSLSGPGAPWLLSKLSGLDFAADPLEGQHCARTRMAHVAVVVHYHQVGSKDSPFVYDLLFDRSLAKYLWNLLTASASHADDLAKAHG